MIMTTSVVALQYAPQILVPGYISGGNNLSFQVSVPADAKPGAVGSVSLASDVGFNACVDVAPNSKKNGGAYANVDVTRYFQIAGGTNPNEDYYQVAPGEDFYVNITIAHDGKQGGGNWPEPKRIRAECRAAQ